MDTSVLFTLYGWWFQTFFIFIIYGKILPIDFHIFQDGYCTTNQLFLVVDRIILHQPSVFGTGDPKSIPFMAHRSLQPGPSCGM
jgi:hypothetical protein